MGLRMRALDASEVVREPVPPGYTILKIRRRNARTVKTGTSNQATQEASRRQRTRDRCLLRQRAVDVHESRHRRWPERRDGVLQYGDEAQQFKPPLPAMRDKRCLHRAGPIARIAAGLVAKRLR